MQCSSLFPVTIAAIIFRQDRVTRQGSEGRRIFNDCATQPKQNKYMEHAILPLFVALHNIFVSR